MWSHRMNLSLPFLVLFAVSSSCIASVTGGGATTISAFRGDEPAVVDSFATSPKRQTEAEYSHPLLDQLRSSEEDAPSGLDALIGALSRHWMGRVDLADAIKTLYAPDSEEGTNSKHLSLRRSLADGDFAALNTLLEGAAVKLPDATISQKILFSWLTLDLTNMRCKDISVKDILVSFDRISDQKMTVGIEIVGLDLSCDLDWRYKYSMFHDGGSAQMVSDDNSAKTVIALTSLDFTEHPPNGSVVELCEPTINIVDINIQGDFVASILNAAENLIRERVANEIEGVLCIELGSLGSSAVSDLISTVSEIIEGYLGTLPPELANPLYAEKNMVVPQSVKLLNLTDTANSIGGWFNSALREADQMLGSATEDPDSPTGTGQDLGVNKILRSLLLDEDRAYVLPVSSWPSSVAKGGIIFQGNDMLTETTIALTQIKIIGLDTFTLFDPLNNIGLYTLSNSIKWRKMAFEVDLTITMKPSSHSSSVIVSTDGKTQVERITIKTGADNVEADISFLLALNQDTLGGIQLGSVLETSRIMSCLVAAIHQAQLTGLSVSVEDIHTPTLTGFISKGIDRILGTASDAVFEMYEAALLDALPNVFQMTVRGVLNDILLKLVADSSDDGCPVYKGGLNNNGGLIDFRDMFLSAEESVASGGSGQSPYGDVGPMLMSLLNEQVLSPGNDGRPKINSMLIGPMTKSQSGQDGMLRFVSDLFRIKTQDITDLLWSSFAESVELKMFDTRLENLDTMRHPIVLLEPSSTDPIELQNIADFGFDEATSRATSVPRPLGGSIRALLHIGGDTPLKMKNDVDIHVETPQLGMLAHVLAAVSEKKFMEFPVRSVTNLYCWLAAVLAPDLDEDGIRVESSGDVGVALSKLVMALSSIRLDMACVACTSSGLEKLPEVIDLLEEVGTVEELKERLVGFAGELLEGEWVQSQVDRFLADSSKQCPHDSAYEEGYVPTDYGPSGFPDLSRDTLELVVLSGAVLLQVGVVVTAESHIGLNAEIRDPLAGQTAMDVPSDANLLDFSDLSGSLGALGNLADSALDQVRTQFGGMVKDTTGPNAGSTGEDLYVNVMLREMLLDNDRAFVLPLDLRYDVGGVSLALNAVRILGFDTFKDFDVLDAIGKYTLLNKISFQHLDLELDVSVNMNNQDEHMKVSIGLDEVDAEVALLLALDLDRIGDIELGSVLRLQKILPCVLSAARAVDLSQLSVSIGDVKEPSVIGFISDEVDQAIKLSTEAVFDEYKSVIVQAVPAFFDVTVREVVNKIITGYMSAESTVSCPALSSPEMTGFVNFHDLLLPESNAAASGGKGTSPYGDVFRSLMEIVDEYVLATDGDGLSKINDMLVGPMTNSQSDVTGALLFPGDLFGGASDVAVGGFEASVEVRAFDASIENLDSMGDPMDLFEPAKNQGSVLDNTVTFGVGQEPLRASVGFLISINGDGDDLNMRNEIVVSADLSAASVVVAALVKIAEQPFLSFPLRDILNINCWLATMPAPPLNEYGVRPDGLEPTLAFQELALSIAQLRLNVDCIDCTSPGFEEMAQMLSSPEGIKDATKIANSVANYISGLIGGDFMHTQFDRMLSDAAKKCPHRGEYDPTFAPSEYKAFETGDQQGSSLNFLVALLIVGSLLFAFLAIVAVLVKCIVRRRHRKWLASLSQEEISNVHMDQVKELEREKELCQRSKALSTSQVVPLAVRIFMPLIIVGNIALFLSGHLSLGATVSIKAELAGEPLVVEEFFKFSMAYSVGEMWNAGAKELAVLILIFSGVWPYTKQFISLVLWFMPPTRVSTARRGTIFLWLDALAKWSMIDIFVLLATVAAFRISITSPDGLAFLPDDFYTIDLMVIPLWGLYANFLAQLVSQVSSHFIIYYHRKVIAAAATDTKEEEDKAEENIKTLCVVPLNDDCVSSDSDGAVSDTFVSDSDSEELHALCNHSFQTGFDTKGRQATVRRWVNKAVIFAAATSTVLIILGCTLYSFSLEVLGIIGLAVESGQNFEQAKQQHNLFTLVGVIMEEARFLDTGKYYVGLGTLSALLILTVLIVPIILIGVLVWQWFAKMKDRTRARMHVGIEILQAWQYVEVFILAIIITSWQIGGVSDFMVNEYCGNLDQTFSSMVYYGILDQSDAQCFRVEARLEKGVYVLIAAALVFALLNHFVCKAAQQRDHEDEERVRNVAVAECSVGEALNRSTSDDEFGDEGETETDRRTSAIHPVPVRFTDNYGFLLVADGSSTSSRNGFLPRLRHRAQDQDPGLSSGVVHTQQSTQIDNVETGESDAV